MANFKLPGIKYIDISLLVVDGEYQRDLNLARVERMAQNFDPSQLGVLCVADRKDGLFRVIDGQHRKAALDKLGFSKLSVPCTVISSNSVAAEAKTFIELNTGRRPPTAFDLFRSALASQEEEAIIIRSVLNEVGVRAVAHNDPAADGIRAVATVRSICHWHGPDMLSRILTIAKSAWPNDTLHGLGAVVLDALTAFIATHASRGQAVDDAALIRACGKLSAKEFSLNAASPRSVPAYKHMASDLCEPYNKAVKRDLKVEWLTPRTFSKRPRRPAAPEQARSEVA